MPTLEKLVELFPEQPVVCPVKLLPLFAVYPPFWKELLLALLTVVLLALFFPFPEYLEPLWPWKLPLLIALPDN